MARILPDLSDYKFFSPFSYANAADLLGTGDIYVSAVVLGIVVLAGSVCAAHLLYRKKDLAV